MQHHPGSGRAFPQQGHRSGVPPIVGPRLDGLGVAALDYRRRGWAPIPVPLREKNPGRRGWQGERLDEDEVGRAWRERPRNIGVILGEPSGGLVDVDLDAPEAARLAPLFLPPTQAVFGRTGKPRSHRLYRVRPAPRTEQWSDRQARGAGSMLVELRGEGAQTIFPPSIHPSGEAYAWVEEGAPADVEGAELRQAVRRLAVAVLLARHWPQRGSRHAASLAVAGVLLSRGWEMEEAARAIVAVARMAGDEEAEERGRNVASTAERRQRGEAVTGVPALADLLGGGVVDQLLAWTGEKKVTPGTFGSFGSFAGSEGAPWETPIPFQEGELPPFPVECLPAWQREFVAGLATATQTPPDLAALLVLSATAVAVAGKVELVARPGWIEPLNLYTVTALPSGSRKSAVFAAVVAPLEAYEEQQVRDGEAERQAAQTRHKIAEQALQRAQTEAAKAEDADRRQELTREAERLAQELLGLSVPPRPRLLADDATPERLASLLAEQGGRMALLSPEGDVFDLMAGRYSSSGSANLGVYLKGHAGDSLRVDRIGRPAEYVKHPTLTIGISPQPSVIEGLARTAEFRGRGLLARFCYALPESLVGRRQRNAPPLSEAVRAGYGVALGRLLRLPPATDAFGTPDRWQLRLSPEALERLLVFLDWVEPQLAEFGALAALRDWGSKLPGAVARCAGLLHLAEHAPRQAHPWALPVAAETVARAVRIGEYLIPHARAAFSSMGADPRVEDARYLLRWLPRRRESSRNGNGGAEHGFSRRDLLRETQWYFKRAEAVDAALSLLVQHGYLRALPEPEGQRTGRPPSARYAINPLWYSQNCQNCQNPPVSQSFADETLEEWP